MKTLVEVFKTLVQQRLAEMVVVMLTLVLSLNGPWSSCGCGRTVLFSWCWPSGMRQCVTSSASTAATWVSRQRKPASSSSAISSHPTTLQPRPGSRMTTSSMLWCLEEEEEDEEDVVGVRGLASLTLGFWQSCSVSGVSGCWSRRRQCSGMCLAGFNVFLLVWMRAVFPVAALVVDSGSYVPGWSCCACDSRCVPSSDYGAMWRWWTDTKVDSRPAQSCDFAALVGVFNASVLLFSALRFWQPLFMSRWSTGMRIVWVFLRRRSRIQRYLVRQWIHGSGHFSHLARGH